MFSLRRKIVDVGFVVLNVSKLKPSLVDYWPEKKGEGGITYSDCVKVYKAQ